MEWLGRQIEQLGAAIDALQALGIHPALVAGALVGMLVSWLGTQALKRPLGLRGRRCTAVGAMLAALPALSIGMVAVGDLGWIAALYAFWTAVAVSAAAPLGYKILRTVLRRWKPHWAQALSGDPPAEAPDEHDPEEGR